MRGRFPFHSPADPTPQGRSPVGSWWLLAALVVVAGVALGLWLHAERQAVLVRESERVSGQARVVAQVLSLQMQGVHRALGGVRDELGRATGQATEPKFVSGRFQALAAAMPGVRTMFQVDAEGTVTASSREELIGLNFKGSAYLEIPPGQLNRDMTYVSKPFRSPLGPYVICAARVLTDPAGRYAGALVASFDPDYFTATLQSALNHPDARSTLIHGSGILYVNAPALQAAHGTDVNRPGSFFRQHRQSGLAATVHSGKVAATGEQRLVALHSVAPSDVALDHPLVVAVTRELTAVYRSWWERLSWVVALFTTLSLGAALWLRLRQRQVQVVGRLHEQAANQLRASAERLDLALRAADLGLWDWRSGTNELMANEREMALLGHAGNDPAVLAREWPSLVHADDQGRLHDAQAHHLRDRTSGYTCEHRMRRADGEWIWVATHATVVECDLAGLPIRTVGTHMDITQRRRSESLLQASLQEARDIKLALDEHAIVAITDERGRITSVNDKFCQLSQFPREELLGQDHRIINSGHHPKEFFRELWSTLAAGRVWRGEIRNRAKDGSLYWVATTIVPFLGGAGRPRQYVAIRTDITDLKQLQVQLQQQRDQLEHTNRELEEFAIFASHDLQEPLRRVRSLVDLLRQRSGRLLDERSVGYLDQMAGSSERLQRLIRDLLNLSRLSHEEPHRRPVDLKEITRDVLADLEDTVTESHAQITVGDLPVLWADPVQLRLLMQNLVSNALKFSAPHRAPVVDIQALPEGPGRWRVEVRDNGVGLSDADIDQVFKPFKRVSPSVEPAGSGLGLTLCSRIIQRHQGRLWVQSVLGEGSRFCFVLSDEAPVPVPVPKVAPSLPARALRPDAATPGPKQAEQLP